MKQDNYLPDRRNASKLLLLLGSVLLSACSSSGGGGESPVAQLSTPPTSVQSTATGTVYTDSQGLTLYTFESDSPGVSTCYDSCEDIWPPLYATDDAVAADDFSVVERNDGTRQWAFKNYPLYGFHLDAAAGDIQGEGVNGVWFVARPNPWQERTVNDTTEGLVFAGQYSVRGVTDAGAQDVGRNDREGFTLYTFHADDAAPGTSTCNGMCANVWPPLYADRGARASGDFSIIERDDGSRQWAFKSYPVYFYKFDTTAGQTLGHDIIGAGDLWYAARPDPLQVLASDIASLFAGKGSVIDVLSDGSQSSERRDRDGFTLYTFDADTVGSGISTCNGACADVWPPLYADLGAKPTALLSIITRDDDTLQWAYKGRPLYFFKNDIVAGETNGDNFLGAGDLWFAARNAPVQLSLGTPQGNILVARGEVSDVNASGQIAMTSSDKTGISLYTFDNDVANSSVSTCNDGCAVTWPPLYAQSIDQPAGDFSIINRADGSLQWAYKGLPLYFYFTDAVPGDLFGVYPGWTAAGL